MHQTWHAVAVNVQQHAVLWKEHKVMLVDRALYGEHTRHRLEEARADLTEDDSLSSASRTKWVSTTRINNIEERTESRRTTGPKQT